MATAKHQEIINYLDASVDALVGIGPKTSAQLGRLAIAIRYDLINHFPRAWIDLRAETDIARLRIGDMAICQGELGDIAVFTTKRRNIKVVSANCTNTSGKINLLWFNQLYMRGVLMKTSKAIFVGKVEYNQTFGKFIASPKIFYKQEIIPIYPLTAGLSQYMIRKTIKSVLADLKLGDYLPDALLVKENLISLQEAYQQIHFPDDMAQVEQAKRRLAFNEMLYMVLSRKVDTKSMSTDKFSCDWEGLRKVVAGLPFELTASQRQEAFSIIKSLEASRPMRRLLQGDVGSGKTVVAALATYPVIAAGKQVFIMAPTQLLAVQHHQTFSSIYAKEYKIALVTAAQKDSWQDADIVIGTHALLSDNIDKGNIGLVVIDEQHRFGIAQRDKLIADQGGKAPHYLAMTATPIPRSLAMVLYGDIELGRISEMPHGRKQVITKVVESTKRQQAYDFIDNNIKEGGQAFIICPAIDFKDDFELEAGGKMFEELDKKAVVKEYEALKQGVFKHRRLAALHGRMKSTEKEQILADFREKKIDILVSTSVIEVGIDIPNASIIAIENAERFGLAQLHQFRGRVGRSGQQGYCLLFSTQDTSRLAIMEREYDGFALAEQDLRLRGPGDFVGVRQSGMPDFKMAEFSNIIMLKTAQKVALEIANNKHKGEVAYYVAKFLQRKSI